MSDELKELSYFDSKAQQEIESNLIQVTCTRDVTDNGATGSFAQGVQDFNFSIGGNYGFNPSKSYFRIGLKLVKLNNGVESALEPGHNITYAENVCAGLYNNAYFKAGGQDVSSITSYYTQAAQVKARSMYSYAQLKSWKGNTGLLESNFYKRLNNHSTNGVDDEIPDARWFLNDSKTATIAIAITTGACTLVNATNYSKIEVGDTLEVDGKIYHVDVAPDDDIGTNMVVRPAPYANVNATTNCLIVKKRVNNNEIVEGEIFVIFQPPIGIFDYNGVFGAGDFRIQLNPDQNYRTNCVQSETLVPAVSETDYRFNVTSLQFYAHIQKVAIPASITYKLPLTEMHLQSKTLNTGTSQSQLDFTVPPSTKLIVVFVQKNSAGTSSEFPGTLFTTTGGEETDLRTIQLTYANKTLPSTDWDSKVVVNTLQLQQRYYDTFLNLDSLNNEGGTRTFRDWLESGPMYAFNFSRSYDDRSTHVQLRLSFGNMVADTNVFICAYYTRMVQITSTNGYISNVTSMST